MTSYKVAIRKNETGEIRIALMDVEWLDISPFLSCDCNRELFFEDECATRLETECGEGRFAVLYAEFPDGSRILIDEDPLPLSLS